MLILLANSDVGLSNPFDDGQPLTFRSTSTRHETRDTRHESRHPTIGPTGPPPRDSPLPRSARPYVLRDSVSRWAAGRYSEDDCIDCTDPRLPGSLGLSRMTLDTSPIVAETDTYEPCEPFSLAPIDPLPLLLAFCPSPLAPCPLPHG